MLKLFNTLTGKKEPFRPIDKRCVGLYTCGPSVYGVPHIGNFRTYVAEDVLKRYLLYKGYKVNHVMNITDIEDKSVRSSNGDFKRMIEITRKNTEIFRHWRDSLRIMHPTHMPCASETVPEMVALIKTLMRKGYAYRADDGSIYYKISKFKKYGELSKRPIPKEAFSGRCVSKDDYFQREAGDFILWKALQKSDGDVFYKTDIGYGRPGWNIECSAMSKKYLGNHFDIHAGGIDNVFSHHENEIAQSEAANGEKFVNYWFHPRHLMINGKKMSKSLGNVYTPGDLFRMGFTPRAIRYLYLSTHYRKKLNFTFALLRSAEKTICRCSHGGKSLSKCPDKCKNIDGGILAKKALSEFESAMDDDLDTPRALEVFCCTSNRALELSKKGGIAKKGAKELCDALAKMDSVLRIL